MIGTETYLKLAVEKVLIYYDLPQLFIAKDQIGTKYVCLFIDSNSEFAEYISVSVSQAKLNGLILGEIDLRTALINSETGIWYFVTFNENEEMVTNAVNFSKVDEKYLPDEGFKFPEIEQNDNVILKEVTEKNNAIVHLSFSDAYNRESMNIEVLGDFIKLFQNLVKYSYKKAISVMKSRPDLDNPKNYTLRAFATSPGSFNIHLESIANTDLFGSSNIEFALSKIDNIVGDVSKEKELLEVIKLSKGHTVNAYKKILENIIKNNVNISYKWVSPSDNTVHRNKINKVYAEKAIEIISAKKDLDSEVKEFVGIVTEVDSVRGTWRIVNEDDGKSYSGKGTKSMLGGITIDTIRYKFICDEIVEMLEVSEKEKISYNLLMVTDLTDSI